MGDSGNAYDSVIATHYVRLLWFFFHLCMRFIVRNIHRIIQTNFL